MKSLILVCCGALGAMQVCAQTNNTRALTLEEAIQQAIEHNYNVQDARYLPRISQLTLKADYGAYDPNFSVVGYQRNSTQGGGTDPTLGNITVPPSTTDAQHYDAGFTGRLPTGLSYDLFTSADKSSGVGFTTVRSNGIVVATEPVISPKQWRTSAGAIQLRQPLLNGFWWYSGPEYQIALDKKTLKINELEVRDQLIQTVTDTELAYYELVYAYENIKVQQAALELAERQVLENRRKVEVGSLAPLDEKQAESDAAARRAALIEAYGLLEARQNDLKRLITDQYRNLHETSFMPADKLIVVPEKFDIQESWRKGITLRPEYLQAKVNLERVNLTAKQYRNQLLPKLDAIGDYTRNGVAPTLGESWADIRKERLPSYTFGGQLQIPLSNRSARYNYRAAKEQVGRAELSLRSTEQTILIAIDNAIKAANTHFQQIQSTRAAREYAELALSAEQKKLEVGKSTSFQVLSLQRDLTNRRVAEIRAIADYNKDLAEISRQEGTTLDRFNVKVRIY